ncbi:MAG: hypothetical protein JJE04_18540 [Acidobacteriia bacterium]|nr:hypothetical protein [Terriglobia bacterium]
MTHQPSELASQILFACQRHQPVPSEPLRQLLSLANHIDPVIATAASIVLFRDLVEPLSDSFEPDLCLAYAGIFSSAIESALPDLPAAHLLQRYQSIRAMRPCRESKVSDVIVLSRVTLGADVAVTSLMLDAAKKRFPSARIHFAGSAKAYELFNADPRILHLRLPYARGGALADRLSAGLELRDLLQNTEGIVIDPDSRLTQLGLLPVCGLDRYFFFESRSYGADGPDPIGKLAQDWIRETFSVDDAKAFIAPAAKPLFPGHDLATLSLGVGDNPAKRIPDPFEQDLLRHLVRLGLNVFIDQGTGGEEADRVQRAIQSAGARPGQIQTWRGAFAPFAATIAASRLYVGYDSAGQHVAATCGTPLVTLFAGFVSPRMFHRWSPRGPGPMEVIRVENPDPAPVLDQAKARIAKLLALPR